MQALTPHAGDVALVAIFIYKSYIASTTNNNSTMSTVPDNSSNLGQSPHKVQVEYHPILPDYLQLPDHYNMKDLLFYIAVGIISSQIMYQVLVSN